MGRVSKALLCAAALVVNVAVAAIAGDLPDAQLKR